MRTRLLMLITAIAAVVTVTALPAARQVAQPAQPGSADSLKFAVIGDNGTGQAPQYEVGQQMASARAGFAFDFVIMLGDNLYGRQDPQDFVEKFERPYASLLGAGVTFHAALGNHDKQSNRDYKGFNMGGQRYYTFVKKHVRFVVLDTNLLDQKQIAWAAGALGQPHNGWTICYFHHPIYSDGVRHGPDVELRVVLEPLMVRHGVDVVFSGHEHFYERIKPQKGITYFIEGSSGQLRKGGVESSPTMAVAYAEDQTFMLVEITGDEMSFRTLSRTGRLVDSGVIHRQAGT